MELAETLYVKVEHDREPEDDFFITSDDPADLSVAECAIEVGEYKLVRKVKLTNITTIEEN